MAIVAQFRQEELISMDRVKNHNSRDRRTRRYHGNDLCDEVRSSDPGNIEVHVLVAFTLFGSDTIGRGNLTSIGFLIKYNLCPMIIA